MNMLYVALLPMKMEIWTSACLKKMHFHIVITYYMPGLFELLPGLYDLLHSFSMSGVLWLFSDKAVLQQ